jgi:CPA1 family monovalent cation:H+ antiporter
VGVPGHLPGPADPVRRARDPLPDWRQTFLVSWVGLRGIVSLAAALALPTTLYQGGPPFPYRDLIIFLTFGVILATLVGQGLTLPLVIRALGLHGDDVEEKEEEVARLQMANAALSRLQVLAITNDDAVDLIDRVRKPYEDRLRFYGPRRRGLVTPDGEVICRTGDEVTRVALQAEREMLVRLRDDDQIGDDVLRKLQTELDLQEARLAVSEDAADGR